MVTMGKSVDFYFDFGSPATYLAFTQLPGIAASCSATVNWKPMLLGAVFKATGNSSPASVPAKGKYTFVDFTRHAKRYGVPFSYNPNFPINTITLMRGATGMQMHEPARFAAYVAAVFNSMWVQPANLNDPAVMAAELTRAGFDPAQLLALTQAQDVKDKLKDTTDEAIARGVFGAPTMFVGDQMFFGQDRLEWVREALA
jgi:2-hydroxychromene-2-carboxylate isomerase